MAKFSGTSTRSKQQSEEAWKLTHLAAVRVWASVGHAQEASFSVLLDEVFVPKLAAVNGFASSAIALSEISTLR